MSDQPNTDPQTGATSGSVPPSGAPARRTTGGSVRWTPPSPEHLQRMLPQYEVLEIIGQGGMGAVYRAKQISLDRLVAIKILPPEAADDEHQFIQRFKNEARTMARMLHPTIVAVFDFGETTEGQLYFVMEYVDGTDVSIMIKEQGKLLPAHALAITAHVCDALQYAHSNGIIHRDIKPANILLNKEGAIKVADFGLAKMHDPSLTMGMTQSGKTMGTPDFVAPESLTLGMTADHRADLYAIGVMLYQMLTGKIPRGNFRMPSQMVPGLDARFDAIIQRAMQEDREERHQSALEIRRDLDVILTTPEIKAESAPPPRKPVARGPQTKTEAAPTASARELAQQSAPPPHKPVARGPQTGHKSTPALAQSAPLTDSNNAVVPKKPPIVPIGIGAAALLGVGSFFIFKSPEPKPQPVVPIQETPKLAPTPQFVQSPPPMVPPTITKSHTPSNTGSAKPVMPAPVGVSPPLTGPVNLLSLVDVERDALVGHWEMSPDGLSTRAGESGEKILLFRQGAPAEYDYEIEFTLAGERINICEMLLPLPHASIRWNMGWSSSKPGLFAFGGKLDGKIADAPDRTEAVFNGSPLRSMHRYRCLIEVRNDSLRAVLDGKELVKWSGNLKRLSRNKLTPSEETDPKRFGLVSRYNSKATFHKAELRPPSTGQTPADKPVITAPVAVSPPLTGPVNLLALVDAQRDALKGNWEMSAEELVVKGGGGNERVLFFQRGAPEEYDYEIEFTTKENQWRECWMILPLQQSRIIWGMGVFEVFAFGPRLDGLTPSQSGRTEAMLRRPRLKAGQRYRCVVEVRKNSLRAVLDGEEVVKWSGDLKRFSEGDVLRIADKSSRLGLGSYGTEITFHKAELRPPSTGLKPVDKPITTTPIAVAPTPPTTEPAAPPADPRLAKLEAGFKARYETDAQKPFEAAVATLNQSYAANGIPRARAAALARGSLADVTALDAEKAAMENGTGVPAEDAADTPDSLKALRGTYRSALAKITADRNTKAIPLYNLYLGALDAYTVELTKANKLDEARKVKALRDDLATKKPESSAAVAPEPKAEPPKSFTSSGTIRTPEVKTASGSDSRAAAKWLLINSGREHGSSAGIIAGGKESKLKKEEDIPPGKFDFVELDFGTGTRDLTDEGFQVFKGQKELRRIKVASMHSPELSDAAFAFLADNKELTSVETSNYVKRGDDMIAHLSGLKKITSLNLGGAKNLTGRGMDKMACLPVLTKVTFEGCPAMTDDALKALGTCKKLEYLNIGGTPVTGAGLAALTTATSLQSLILKNCKEITDEGFAALRTLKSLKILNLEVTAFGDAGAAAVADSKSLIELVLVGTKITDAGLAVLASSSSLLKLNMESCTQITENGFAALRGLKSLNTLRIDRTAFGDAAADDVAELKSLQKLQLFKTQISDAGLAKLTTLSNLTFIDVRSTQVTDAGVAAFKKALPNCEVVK